jgi:hypothetical protein
MARRSSSPAGNVLVNCTASPKRVPVLPAGIVVPRPPEPGPSIDRRGGCLAPPSQPPIPKYFKSGEIPASNGCLMTHTKSSSCVAVGCGNEQWLCKATTAARGGGGGSAAHIYEVSLPQSSTRRSFCWSPCPHPCASQSSQC